MEGALGREGNIKVPLDSQDLKIDFITSAAPERGGSQTDQSGDDFSKRGTFDSLVSSP